MLQGHLQASPSHWSDLAETSDADDGSNFDHCKQKDEKAECSIRREVEKEEDDAG